MVTADYIMRSAERSIRASMRDGSSAAVALAFLRALGVPAPRARAAGWRGVYTSRFDSMGECFANHGSPMDGRI